MEQNEITEQLERMGALVEDGKGIDSRALMQDPIVSNRLAVEVLQRIDRDSKPEVVIAPAGEASYFGYSVALASWTRFLYAEESEGVYRLAEGTTLKKKERALIVLDGYDDTIARGLVDLAEKAGAVPLAVLSLTGPRGESGVSCPQVSLL